MLEFILLTPLMFIIMFGTVEFGLVLYARHVAVAAAQEGARTAREERYTRPGSWQKDARAASKSWVTTLVGGLVAGGAVTADPKAAGSLNAPYPQAGLKLSFSVVTVVPWSYTVQATSMGPVECFYTPEGICDGG